MMIVFLLAAAPSSAPPVVITAPPVASPLDRYAGFVKASMPFPGRPGSIADLLIEGNRAVVRIRKDGSVPSFYSVSTVDRVLTLLADRKAEPFWPALLAWGGPRLEALRDRNLAAARAAAALGQTSVATSTAASSVRPPTRAVMLLGEELWLAGKTSEAIAAIETARGSTPGQGHWEIAEWAMLSLRLAHYRELATGVDAALALLAESEAKLGEQSPYAPNFSINRAAMLAEAGRYAEALATIDRSTEQMHAPVDRGTSRLVVGSDRQYAWIRACALDGLGRKSEAAELTAQLDRADEPADRSFVISSTASIRFRLARCTRDVPMAAAELRANMIQLPFGGAPFLVLQPALHSPRIDPQFFRQVREDGTMAAALKDRFRVLPPDFTPALNSWRVPESAIRP